MLESLRVMAELVIGAKINSNESYPKLPPALYDQFSPQMNQFPSGYIKEKDWKIPALNNQKGRSKGVNRTPSSLQQA